MPCRPGDRLKPGNDSRAAINCALLTAGPAGLSCTDLAILVGLQPNGARWHFDRMDGAVFVARLADRRKNRVFHADFREAGEAYLAAATVGRQRPGGPSDATFLRVLAIIEGSGRAGIGIKALMQQSDLARPTLNLILPRLVREHGVHMERTRGSGKGRPAHYWGREWLAFVAATPALRATYPAVKPAPKKAATSEPQARQVIVPPGLKVTVCPSGTDHRFTVKHPTPFFSHMAPGSYLSTGSAIERAYGERA